MIGTFVSARNDCRFCKTAHAAIASVLLGGDDEAVRKVELDPESAPITPKLKRLLAIAGLVQQGGQHVTAEAVEAARAEGATDLEIHDTVLIAAAFCMFNRYVDGLAAEAPADPESYRARAARTAEEGYKLP